MSTKLIIKLDVELLNLYTHGESKTEGQCIRNFTSCRVSLTSSNFIFLHITSIDEMFINVEQKKYINNNVLFLILV